MKHLNVAVIGGGFMGKAHALAYAAMPMFFWPAPAMPVRKVIVDLTEAQAAEARLRFGFAESATDWRAVVERDDIDVVDICTPHDSHAEIAIAAAAAGKHIFCEKPLARSAAEARPMLEAVRKAGVIHMVGYNYRRTPAVALARKYIDEGRIGEIVNFRGTYLQDWSADPEGPLSWRYRKEVVGTGAIGALGTHVMDFARYLVGEIEAVSAINRTLIPTRPLPSGSVDRLGLAGSDENAERGVVTGSGDAERGEVEVDDEMIAQVRFASGAYGTLEASRNAWGRSNSLTFEIHGTKGSILFNFEHRDQLQVMFADDPGDARGFRTVFTGPPHPYGGNLWPIAALGVGYGETKMLECHDFFEAIMTGRQPSPNFEDGYRIAEIVDAVVASGEAQGWVEI